MTAVTSDVAADLNIRAALANIRAEPAGLSSSLLCRATLSAAFAVDWFPRSRRPYGHHRQLSGVRRQPGESDTDGILRAADLRTDIS